LKKVILLLLKNISYYLKVVLKMVSTGHDTKWCKALCPWVQLLFCVPLFM